jgi:hypothetical protein
MARMEAVKETLERLMQGQTRETDDGKSRAESQD